MISKMCMVMTLIPSRLQVDNKTAPNQSSEVFLHEDISVPYTNCNQSSEITVFLPVHGALHIPINQSGTRLELVSN